MQQARWLALAAVLAFLCTFPQRVGALAGSAAEEKAEPVRVAFIDTGIDSTRLDDAAVAEGKNYVFPERDTTDRIGHGTAAAALLLGAPELGVTGLCPGAVAVPLVCYDQYPSGVANNGGTEVLCQALREAVDEFGCRVVNISLGTVSDTEALRSAVAYAEERGAVVVSAAGNDNLTAPARQYYPAGYDTVVGVGAADGLHAAEFSQRTGASVLSQGVGLPTVGLTGDGAILVEGTSYACARVSALCAAMLSQDPELSPAEVRQRLYDGALDIGPQGWDADSGWGVAGGVDFSLLPPSFSDVTPEAWYFEAVELAAARGLILGADGAFLPEDTASRAMLAAVLQRLAGAQAQGDAAFPDVPPDAWYAPAAAWAAESGIVTGYEDGRFAPLNPVTREQAAVMLWRYAGSPQAVDGAVGECQDGQAVSGYAQAAMDWAVEAGLLLAADGFLRPGGTLTRAELATLLVRFSEVSPAE